MSTEKSTGFLGDSATRGAQIAAREGAKLAGRSVKHVLEGEARRQFEPARHKLLEGTQNLQCKTARQIDHLATRIRHLGDRISRNDEAHAVARRLEETADYLRFRPTDHVARDAARVIRRNRVLPIVGLLVGGLLAYKLYNRRKGIE